MTIQHKKGSRSKTHRWQAVLETATEEMDLIAPPRLLEIRFLFDPSEVEGWDQEPARPALKDTSCYMPLYIEGHLSSKPTGVSAVFIDPRDRGLRARGDVQPAHSPEDTMRETPTISGLPCSRFLDNHIAKRMPELHQHSRPKVDDIGVCSRREASERYADFGEFSQVAHLDRQVASERPHAPLEHANFQLSRQSIRKRLHQRWTEKCALAGQSLRTTSAGKNANEKATAEGGRRFKKSLFAKCVQDQVEEMAAKLRETLLHPLQEIQSLHVVQEGLQYELLHDQYTTRDLIDTWNDRASSTKALVLGNGPFLDGQLDALSSLMGIGRRTTAALETRLNRLAAKDVSDVKERVVVRKRRSGRPEALMYLHKAKEDLQFVRDLSQTVLVGFSKVEQELGRMAIEALDLYVATRGCVLFFQRDGE